MQSYDLNSLFKLESILEKDIKELQNVKV